MSPPRVQPEIMFRFPEGRRDYSPGEPLKVEAVVEHLHSSECRSAEASVLWRTVGQGDEDLYVYSFERLDADDVGSLEMGSPLTIETRLPESPLSYNGVNVKVCWSVRLRLFLGGYRHVLSEAPFRLGEAWSPEIKDAQL